MVNYSIAVVSRWYYYGITLLLLRTLASGTTTMVLLWDLIMVLLWCYYGIMVLLWHYYAISAAMCLQMFEVEL